MNKKQKILPILALVAFSAVIALDYGSIGRERGHIEWTSMTAAGESNGNKIGFKGNSLYPAPTKPNVFDQFDPKPSADAAERVMVNHPDSSLGLNLYPGIKDVRMPLFVLAVFYSGLLLVTADKKEKTK